MPHINVGKENSGSIDIHYEDWGSGKPVILIHGFPVSGRSWEKQVPALMEAGYRVLPYDRRGFGYSSQPAHGYDYNTFADDLHQLITQLKLEDVTLVGMSTGAGEVARYLGKYGSERVSRAVILSGITPYLLKAPDNPQGVDRALFTQIEEAIMQDRLAYLTQFLNNFYNVDQYMGTRVSEEVVRDSWNVAASSSPIATLALPGAWLTDFRDDLRRIDIPALVMHGENDRICPIETTAYRSHEMIRGSRLLVVNGGPHGALWTHADEVNAALVDFLAGRAVGTPPKEMAA